LWLVPLTAALILTVALAPQSTLVRPLVQFWDKSGTQTATPSQPWQSWTDDDSSLWLSQGAREVTVRCGREPLPGSINVTVEGQGCWRAA